MRRYAIDVALLPPDPLNAWACRVNAELVTRADSPIRFGPEGPWPHVSLAMAVVTEADLPNLVEALRQTVSSPLAVSLRAERLAHERHGANRIVSSLHLERNAALLSLHEIVMDTIAPWARFDPRPDDFAGAASIAESTLRWVAQFPLQSAHEAFRPHITLGMGPASEPIPQDACPGGVLAVCHLGNHCTCRHVLARI